VRRPAPEVLWTVVLVLVLAGAGAGLAVVALGGEEPGTAPAVPESSPTTPESPSPSPAAPSTTAGPPRATPSPCPDRTRRVPLRVLTLNTHGGRGPAGFDLGRVAQLIRGADVDVALLQEVDRFRGRSRHADMARVLAARTGMEMAYGRNVLLRGRAVSGTATLSRLPIRAQRNIRLPTSPGNKGRGLLRTDLDLDGVRVSVFNTHLEHRVPRLRLRQARALRAPVAAAAPHPVVLGGDLNAVPSSPPVATLGRLLDDSWPGAGFGPGPTSPAGDPRRRIDYLLHSPFVRVGSVDVLTPLVSDHRAVRARLVLTVAGDRVCVPDPGGGR